MDVLYWNGCGPSRETTVLPAFSHMDYFTGPTWHSPYCSDELHSWSLFFLGKILRYPEMHHIQLWPQRKEKKKKPPFALGVFTDPENVFYKIFLCYPKMHHTQLWPYFLFKKTERKKKTLLLLLLSLQIQQMYSVKYFCLYPSSDGTPSCFGPAWRPNRMTVFLFALLAFHFFSPTLWKWVLDESQCCTNLAKLMPHLRLRKCVKWDEADARKIKGFWICITK